MTKRRPLELPLLLFRLQKVRLISKKLFWLNTVDSPVFVQFAGETKQIQCLLINDIKPALYP